MAIKFVLSLVSTKDKKTLKPEIVLERHVEDNGNAVQTWKQVGSQKVHVENGMPMVGRWGKGDKRSLNENCLFLGPEGQNLIIVFLDQFFPATPNKSGKGSVSATGGWLRDFQVSVTFQITEGEANAYSQGFSVAKCRVALGYAFDGIWGRVGGKFKEFGTKENVIALLAGIWAMSRQTPRLWINLLRQAAGRFLLWADLFFYAQYFDEFGMKVSMATTEDELKQAGMYIKDVLAQLVVDGVLQAVMAAAQAMGNAKGLSDANGRNSTPPPESMKGKVVLASGAIVEFETPNYKAAIAECKKRANACRQMADSATDPAKVREFELQAKFWMDQVVCIKTTVRETLHHRTIVKEMAPHASAINKKANEILSSGPTEGHPKQKLADLANYLIKVTDEAGCPMTGAEATEIAEAMIKARQSGQLGDVSWDLHDVESVLTSKLNAAVVWGMAHPVSPPKNWTVAELELAQNGINPKTNRPFTPEEFKALYGKQADDLLARYGSMGEVFNTAREAKVSIDYHNLVAHHNPKTFKEFWEMGCDVAHALAQKRAYRSKVNSVADIENIINSEMPAHKRAWIKLGMACLKQIGSDRYVNPPTSIPGVTD
jgi:hypothetical protein